MSDTALAAKPDAKAQTRLEIIDVDIHPYPKKKTDLLDFLPRYWREHTDTYGAPMWEVAPYMVRPTFGQGTFIVLMNLDKWNSLSDEAKGTWESAGRLFEERAFEVISGVAERDEKTMLENGAEISQLGQAAAERINLRYNEAIWEQIVRNGGDGAQQLVDFVKDNDLVFNGQ